MKKTALAVPLALAVALALSACSVSISSDSRSGEDSSNKSVSDGDDVSSSGVKGDAQNVPVSDTPVQQAGESDSRFAERTYQYGDVDRYQHFSYDCDGGPWSSTHDDQVVLLRGHCTDVDINHRWVEIWVSQADRINVGTDGYRATVVANQIGDLTIAAGWVRVYTGAVGSVAVSPKD